MDDTSPQCVDAARNFDIAELFFSTTNRQGVLRSGNAVFMRIAGYEDHELIGAAHSKIRHPDMPYAVFQLLWDTLLSGKSIAAYVKNRAKSGEYYWVMAVAAPADDGFLSVRLKPSCGLLETVEQVYARVRQFELDARGQGLGKEEIIQQSMPLLLSELSTLGFDGYDSFMWHALSAEMVSRQEQLGHIHCADSRNVAASSESDSLTPLQRLRRQNESFDSVLGAMLARLTQLHSAIAAFPEGTDAMQEQSRLIGLAALNSRISAESEPLKAVAQAMAESEQENRVILRDLRDAVGTLTLSLDELSFNVCVSALQGEICSHFLTEIDVAAARAASTVTQDVALLIEASRRRLDELFQQLDAASNWFRAIESRCNQLECTDRQLQFIRLVGITESADLAADHTFRDLFSELQNLLGGMRTSCDSLIEQVKVAKAVIRSLGQDKQMLTDRFRTVLLAHTEFEEQQLEAAAGSAPVAA